MTRAIGIPMLAPPPLAMWGSVAFPSVATEWDGSTALVRAAAVLISTAMVFCLEELSRMWSWRQFTIRRTLTAFTIISAVQRLLTGGVLTTVCVIAEI